MPSATLLGQSVLSGIVIGSLYGLLGLGMSLSWGMLRQVNLAHFALAFLGGYLTFQLSGRLDPFLALADKYRADAIGARTPVASLRRQIEQMLNDVDAVVVWLPPEDAVFGWDYPALRDMLHARGAPHVCLRGDQYQALSPEEHAQLDAMVAAAARLQEARHG